jgi:hypothetical protein
LYVLEGMRTFAYMEHLCYYVGGSNAVVRWSLENEGECQHLAGVDAVKMTAFPQDTEKSSGDAEQHEQEANARVRAIPVV